MDKHFLAVLFFCLAVLGAPPCRAEGFGGMLERAEAHMRSGEHDKALELLREMQTDYPDSHLVQYAMATALYQRGQREESLKAVDEAAASYAEAAAVYDKIRGKNNPGLNAEAAFGAVNARARAALAIPPQEKRNEAVAALRAAVSGYEAFLGEHPGHTGARANLDHVQLRLKEILSQPAPENEQQQEQQQPPEEQKPVVIFQNANTEIPKATTQAEGNTLKLVMPDGKGGQSQ